MASRSDIEAGKAHVLLTIKDSLSKGLRAAQDKLQSFGTNTMKFGAGITAAGAAITGAMVGAVAKFAEMGGVLADLSGRTGMAASNLAELKFAAEQSGAGIEDIEKAVINMQKKGVAGTFDQIAERIAAIEDPAERTKAAIEAWGKSGVKLLPMVSELAALREEARELGLVPKDEAVADAAAIGDAWDKVKSVLDAVVFEVGAALVPVIAPALEMAKNILATVIKWVRENQGLVRTVALIGAGLLAAGTAITTIGSIVWGLGAAFGAIASAVGVVLTPVGLVVAAVVAIGVAITAATVAFFKFTQVGRNVAASIGAFFAPLFDFLKKGFGVIIDALMSGDIGAAADIAIKMISGIFMTGWNAMLAKIFESLTAFLGKVNSIFSEILPDEINLIARAEETAGKMGAGFRDKAGDTWSKMNAEIDAIKAELDAKKAERDAAGAAGGGLGLPRLPDAPAVSKMSQHPFITSSATVATLPGFGREPELAALDKLVKKADDHIVVARRIEARLEKLGFV